MAYLVLARKWRPQRFADVVGQAHVTQTLSNAIVMDRVAHAFVFSGVRGVGKTSLARILAKSLNCKSGPTVDPCGECESCRSITAGTSVDVIEIDGASNNSVEDIRQLRETVPYRPAIGRFKIYVIDEVHMLSASAFNALLKTLEEPPPHVKFVFATTEAHKIPVTILSRCQRYDFRRIPTNAVMARIRHILAAESIEAEEGALSLIGREAEGSMRDALSILDQVLAASIGKITAADVAALLGVVDAQVLHDISAALLRGDAKACLAAIRDVDHQGYDIPTFSRQLLEHLRNLVVAGVAGGDPSLLGLPEDQAADLTRQATGASLPTLHRLFKHFAEGYESIARSSHPKILLEATLARLASLEPLEPLAQLAARLEGLAKAGGGGSATATSGGTPPTPGPRLSGSASGSRTNSESAAPAQRAANPLRQPPEPPQPSPMPPVSTAVRGATLERDWERAVHSYLQRERPGLASIMECGVPSHDEGSDLLRLSFPSTYKAVATLAENRLAELGEAITQSTGVRLRVEISVEDNVAEPLVQKKRIEEQDQARKRDEEARRHPIVQQVLSELGGVVRRVRLEACAG
ncbi:MAG: DNA polymerase III subunit gamma/tau [Myxococcota bacterium]|jgi:DNA polymerase-3 subunit gamma/tau|nr:DNA polymerase III subunit gamma/tau [Myxococcota bacterium]